MRNITIAVLTLIAVVSLTSAQAAEGPWKEYKNERFGFTFRYPASLVASGAGQNGAGREFHSANKEFSVSGEGRFLSGDTLEQLWQEELKERGTTVTYKKKSDDWYVVSGIKTDGTEFYHKVSVKGGNCASLSITYPHAKSSQYDAWVRRIEKSFVPFLQGDYDRSEG